MTPPVLRVFGVPMDLGQRRRGVDMGPSAIRYAGLNSRLERLGRIVRDSGNISAPVVEQIDRTEADGLMHNADAVGTVCRAVHERMHTVIAAGEIGIFLGGDHSISIGTVSAALSRPGRLGVLWIDAHGDFNTPQTSPSGNIHGMVVAALMGLCPPELTIGDRRLQPGQIVYIGVRDLDDEEKQALKRAGIRIFTMREIDERGMASVMRDALQILSDCQHLHVSLDMDSLEPQIAPGVGTPVPGGLTYREAHLCMEMLADDGRVCSLDVVEVNPILDRENQTARLAVELVSSLFGQRIL
ncbi:MAG: arginase [Candidatus Flexifilum sp.]